MFLVPELRLGTRRLEAPLHVLKPVAASLIALQQVQTEVRCSYAAPLPHRPL
jgi:hypothetical protein